MTTISAVIPTYNRSNEVGRAIGSVLSQTYEDLECIVVDDGSSDHTTEKVRAFQDSRVKYLKHETNRGVSAARNTGIEAAKGEYIAFLDSDDEWKADKIEKQLQEIQSRSGLWNSIYCGVNKQSKSRVKHLFDWVLSEDIGDEGGKEIITSVIAMELAVHAGSTLLAERKSVLDIGGFNETMQRHEELEFLVRLLEDGKMAYLDEELVTLHDTGYPKADLLKQEKSKFLQEVDPYFEKSRQNREKIIAVHELELAKSYFREARWKEAHQHLKEGRIVSIRDLAGLIWAMRIGLSGGSKSGKN